MTTTCPGNPTTQDTCNALSNSFWNGVTCICCSLQGNYYVDPDNIISPCTACGQTAKCGDGNGYCNGITGSKNVPCIQNTTTYKWSAQCPSNVCQGPCSGSCGLKEWFAFSECKLNATSGFFECTFSIRQWKSYITYALILLLFLLLILLIVILIY